MKKPPQQNREPYIGVAEVLWKPDETLLEIRKNQHWKDFHHEAGKRGLYFDHIVKEGRGYSAAALTLSRTAQGGWVYHLLAKRTAKTILDAMEAAYRDSGKCDDGLDRIMDLLMGRAAEAVETAEQEDDFASIFD